ncbi:MAG: GGDEF domain-containing protein [Lachnospiraceae bacterium]|nr:GGDEF domain-containing protein [Lachnospiraceae bacterium]
MEKKKNVTAEIRELEAKERKTILKAMFYIVLSCLCIDIMFFLYYNFTDSFVLDHPMRYMLLRVISPFVVNVAVYAAAVLINRSSGYGDKVKTYMCCFALMTIAGSMGFFHNYFIVLLCAPALCMAFSTVFHDRKLMFYEIGYILVLLAATALFMYFEYPDQRPYYMQQVIVAGCMSGLFSIVAFSMEYYSYAMVEVLRKSNTITEEYKEQLDVDWLTGVYSRSYFQAEASKILRRATEENPVSFAVIDIDNFKTVNDTYGHENGDEVLVTLGSLIKQYNSYRCYTGRYGGEEFVFIFEGDDAEAIRRTLNEIRECFSMQRYSFMEQRVTFSCGVITIYQPESFEDVFAKADQNLYISKGKGKNCVTG